MCRLHENWDAKMKTKSIIYVTNPIPYHHNTAAERREGKTVNNSTKTRVPQKVSTYDPYEHWKRFYE